MPENPKAVGKNSIPLVWLSARRQFEHLCSRRLNLLQTALVTCDALRMDAIATPYLVRYRKFGARQSHLKEEFSIKIHPVVCIEAWRPVKDRTSEECGWLNDNRPIVDKLRSRHSVRI